jgi:alkylhydroperoxidase family enzyme
MLVLSLAGNPVGGRVVKYIVSANKVGSGSTLQAATQQPVKLRASQINGCGFCIDMHTKATTSPASSDDKDQRCDAKRAETST